MEKSISNLKLTLVLPALGLHQLALSNRLYELIGEGFAFVATQKITSGRFGLDYDTLSDNYPYVIKAYNSTQENDLAKNTILQSDIIILGSSPIEYYNMARENKDALILVYSERLFKKSSLRRFIPSIRNKITRQFFFGRKDVVAICSSAYLPKDLDFFKENITTLKWGYFPQINEFKINDRKYFVNKKVNLLWAGRYIDWKRPFDALKLAILLKNDGIDFKLNFIGNGALYNKLQKYISNHNLDGYVKLNREVTTAQLFEKMKESDIFLFTSNFQEGWGAVLNEAMNAGCACICSHAPGSVPFIIENNNNGLIYRCGDIQELYQKTLNLINNKDLIMSLGNNAYLTILNEWNHTIASKRLIDLAQRFKETGELVYYKDGILSQANIITSHWYKGCK